MDNDKPISAREFARRLGVKFPDEEYREALELAMQAFAQSRRVEKLGSLGVGDPKLESRKEWIKLRLEAELKIINLLDVGDKLNLDDCEQCGGLGTIREEKNNWLCIACGWSI